MKDRWKFCQCCYLNGHCFNQDMDMKCEHYSKQLEDKVERLQEQLKEANDLLKGLYDDSPCQFDHLGYCQEHGSTDGNYICVQGELKEYLERYGVK